MDTVTQIVNAAAPASPPPVEDNRAAAMAALDTPVQGDPPIEAPPAEPPKEAPKEAVEEPKLARIMASNRKLEYENTQLKSKLKAIDVNGPGQKDAAYQDYLKLKADGKKNPIAILEHFGTSYEEATQFQLTGQSPQFSRIKELEARQADYEKKLEEADKKATLDKERQLVENHKKSIGERIKTDSKKYPLINAQEAFDTVYNVQLRYWEEHPELPPQERTLSVDAAADMTEKWLKNQYFSQIERPGVMDVISEKLQALGWSKKEAQQAAQALQDTKTPNNPANGAHPTLTNDLSNGSTRPPASDANLSDEERRQRAMQLL